MIQLPPAGGASCSVLLPWAKDRGYSAAVLARAFHPQARLIVVEGIDGAGTTTVAQRLADRWQAHRRVHLTAQPSRGPVGLLLRDVLGGAWGDDPDPRVLALLFAADRRHQQQTELEPVWKEGGWVVCDRYDYSSLVYQGLVHGAERAAWVRCLNEGIVRPDAALWLRVSVEEAARRRAARDGDREIFDDGALQRRIAEGYARVESTVPGDPWLPVDAEAPVDEVVSRCLRAVRSAWSEEV